MLLDATMCTRSPEKSPPHNFVFVQQIQQGICILAEACSEDHDLKSLPNLSHKPVHEGSFQYIHLHYLVLNFNRYDEVRIGHRLEGRVDQRFIQVKNKAFLVLVVWRCGPYDRLSCMANSLTS